MSDPRHVVLTADGSFATLGHYAPTDAELAAVVGVLGNHAAWHCVMSDSEHSHAKITFDMRAVLVPGGDLAVAIAAFEASRKARKASRRAA